MQQNDKATTDIGATPLAVAAEKGHLEVVRTLLEGADKTEAAQTLGYDVSTNI